jgi:phasin family protein
VQQKDVDHIQQPSNSPCKPLFGDTTMFTADQFLAQQKTSIETLFGLTHKAFEGVEKMVELNVQATKAALAEAATHTQAMLNVKDAQELLALQAGVMQPMAEKAAAYSRHLYDIASSSTTEFSKAVEGQAAELQSKVVNLVDGAVKNAPAGSETVAAVFKSSVTAATNAYEAMQKAVKQASDMAEANLSAVSNTATSAVKATSKKR